MTLPVWVGLLIAALALFPALTSVFAWRRLQILEGDVWTLLTGHLVHWDLRHTALNATGAVLLGLYFKQLTTEFWCITALGALIVCNVGLFLEPAPLNEYRGLSAVLYGWLIVALVQPTRSGAASKGQWVIAAALLVWVLAEAAGFTAERRVNETIPVHATSHVYGIGGALLAMGLMRWLTRKQ